MAAVCESADPPCGVCRHCDKAERGIHPDISVISPDGREIVVSQVRDILRDAYVVPNEAAKKVYIIDQAETMNASAQNAFLKLLEEPPRHAVFVLRTDNPKALLPTVRSRCVELRGPLGATIDTATELTDDFFSALEGGNLKFMEFTFKLDKLSKDEFALFLQAGLAEAARKLRQDGGISPPLLSQVYETLSQAEEYLEFNVGTGHLAGLICAELLDRVR